MRMTRFTDFALRLLKQLAQAASGHATVVGVATAQGLSKHHVGKIAHALAQAGFIEAARGRTGGIRLARPASDISIGAVVRRLEPLPPVVDCTGCAEASACSLPATFGQATAAFLAELDRVSLADSTRLLRAARAVPPGTELRPSGRSRDRRARGP